MKRLIALYGHPDDPRSFDRHYRDVHCALVRRMPRLLSFEFSSGLVDAGNAASPYYLVAEMTYATQDDLQASLSSQEGQEAVADLANFASGGATVLTIDVADGLAARPE